MNEEAAEEDAVVLSLEFDFDKFMAAGGVAELEDACWWGGIYEGEVITRHRGNRRSGVMGDEVSNRMER